MWFGDLVTMRWWDDLWLNESFAEYMSVLAPGAGDPLDVGLDDVRQHREDLGLPAGPAAVDAPDRRRHPRHRGGQGQLRRHHLRQGRLGAQAARRLGRARTRSCGRCGSTSAGTSTATPRWPTCWASSSGQSGRDLSRWPSSGCRPPASTRCGRSSTSTPTGRSPRSRCCRSAGRPPPDLRATGWPSGSTTWPTAGWSAPGGWRSTSWARGPRCRSWSASPQPDLRAGQRRRPDLPKIRLDDARWPPWSTTSATRRLPAARAVLGARPGT